LESLTGLAPARTVRETVGLLLSDSDEMRRARARRRGKRRARDRSRVALTRSVNCLISVTFQAVCRRSYSSSCDASSGHAMSC